MEMLLFSGFFFIVGPSLRSMYQLMLLLLLLRLRRSSLSRAGSRCLWSHNVNMMICSSAFLVSEDASFPFIDPIGRVEP